MATVTLQGWRPGTVVNLAMAASAKVLNETAYDAVAWVQSQWPRDTGFSANTMEVVEEASEGKPSVIWGNITADYAIWIEIGARGRPGRYILRQSLERAVPLLREKIKSSKL